MPAHDLRLGLRQIRKRPGFSAVVLLTLALGIGANTAIFSVIQAVLFETAPFEDADELVFIGEHTEQIPNMSVAYPNFLDWREEASAFEALAAHRNETFTVTGLERPEQVRAIMTSAALFDRVLRTDAALGRTFVESEDQPGQGAVVVLSDKFWRTRFGADPDVLGRQLILDDTPYQVIGVMPAGFTYPLHNNRTAMWLPIGHWADEPFMTNRTNHPGIYVTGRLAAGTTFESGLSNLRSVAASLEQRYPDSNTGNSVAVRPLREHVVRHVKPAILTLAVAVGLVLLMAAVNVANLQLARGATRLREMSLRSALGAGRLQILRQLLVENLILALCGGALGLFVAFASIRFLARILDPSVMPVTGRPELDGAALTFALGISLLCGLATGLAPALQAARRNLVSSLREGSKSSGGVGHQRFKNALVVGQVALAMVLLFGALLFTRSFASLSNADPGFDPAGVLAFDLTLPENRYADTESILALQEALLDEVRALPGTTSVAATLPLLGGWQSSFVVGGQPAPGPGEGRSADLTRVTPGYFETLGVDLQRGRVFDERDKSDTEPVAIIDRTFADDLFAGQDPIGQKVKLAGDPAVEGVEWRTVVGVVDHVKNYGVANESRVEIYVPQSQLARRNTSIVVASDLEDPMALMPAVESALARLDGDQPIANARLVADVAGRTTLASRVLSMLLSLFSGVALALAALGLYGVMAFFVSQRQREIGVRMALGAQLTQVLSLVAGSGFRLIVAGTVVGTGAVLAGAPLLSSQLFGVEPRDLGLIATVQAVLLAVGALAAAGPLRRASKASPVEALRHE
ncbi:MAG: ABC transporter permease [Acidobacteriota bacterium]